MSHIILNPNYVLSNDEIHTLNKLKTLNLSCNRITEIHPDTFKYMTQLRELDISYNQITEINPDTFKYLTHLKVLHISFNKITEIHSDAFKYMTQLRKLYISGNRITKIHSDAFKSLTQLNILDISDNEITEIHPDTFKSLTQLNELYIFGNHITEITFDFVPSFIIWGVTVILPEITEIECHDYICSVCHMNHLDEDYEGEKYGIRLSCQNISDHVVCGECYKRWYIEGKRELRCVACQQQFKYTECKKCV